MALRRFRSGQHGNIAIMAALLLTPIIGFSGLAIDYGTASLSRSRMVAEVDSLALIAARNAKSLAQSGKNDFSDVNAWLQSQIRQKVGIAQIDNFWVDTKIYQEGIVIRADVKWTGQRAATFGPLFGKSSYEIGGKVVASVGIKPFVNLVVLVDVSQSMGIPADRDDQRRQFARESCAFACHLPAEVFPSKLDRAKTTYESARSASPPIKTRVDVAREGLLSIINMVEQENAETPNRVKLSVFTFSNAIQEVVPLDRQIDYAEMRRLVESKVILGREGGGTNMPGALIELEKRINNVGDGTSVSQPRVSILVLSDGVVNSTIVEKKDDRYAFRAEFPLHSKREHEYGAMQQPRNDNDYDRMVVQTVIDGQTQNDNGRMGALDERVCGALTSRGVSVMVIETEYVIPDPSIRLHDGKDDLRFAWLERDGRLQGISDRMKACSSQGFFSVVRDGPQILSELQRMTEAALRAELRLQR